MVKVNDWDEPLFDMGQTKAGRKPSEDDPPKDLIRSYKNKPVTCHVCIITVANGGRLKVPRQLAASELIQASGRRWLLCPYHRDEYKEGRMALPFNTEREKKR